MGGVAAIALSGRRACALEPEPTGSDPSSAVLDWEAAIFAWEFSQLARWSKEELAQQASPSTRIPLDQLVDFAGVPGLALHDTQILAWQRDDCSIIAYRGTEGSRAVDGAGQGEFGKEALDLLTDLRFYQQGLGPSSDGAGIHSGFFEAVEATWPFVQTILDLGKPVVFTGHSLGGALATYAAYKAHNCGSTLSAVWTFGSPRVGNAAFAASYNEALGRVTHRFANEYDIVARLPGRGFPGVALVPEYRHVGRAIVLWADGHADGDWAGLTKSVRISEEMVSEAVNDATFKSHQNYDLARYAELNVRLSPTLTSEEPPPGLLQRLLLGLPGLLEYTDPKKIKDLRQRWD